MIALCASHRVFGYGQHIHRHDCSVFHVSRIWVWALIASTLLLSCFSCQSSRVSGWAYAQAGGTYLPLRIHSRLTVVHDGQPSYAARHRSRTVREVDPGYCALLKLVRTKTTFACACGTSSRDEEVSLTQEERDPAAVDSSLPPGPPFAMGTSTSWQILHT